MPSWRLVDAEKTAREYPYTFYKPDGATIALVRPGENVKAIFEFDSNDPDAPGAERMWIAVDGVGPDGTFQGRLNSNPQYIEDCAAGDRIQFLAKHIIQTEHDPRENPVARYARDCFVTLRVVRDGARVGCLYRAKPEADVDSGWRIMAGDEPESYFAIHSNIVCTSLGSVLNRDDSFRDLLQSPIGSTFRRDPGTGAFIKSGPK